MVIMDKAYYFKEANNILSDHAYYRSFHEDPTAVFLDRYINLFESAYSDNILN